MKPTFLVPPFVALILAGAWNIAQRRSISALEVECVILRKQITEAPESSGGGVTSARGPSKSEKTGWRSLLSALATERKIGSVGQARELIALQRRLAKMTPQEMMAALDEIRRLGLNNDKRGRLEHMIIKLLIRQDPELALTYYADHLDGNFFGWGPVLIPDAFKSFGEKNLTAATAWFDKQIADGKFDLKSLDYGNEGLRMFEGILLNNMLKADPGLAASRLSSHAEDQRAKVLQSVWNVAQDAESSKAYANLVRTLVPADQQQACFAHIGQDLRADMDYSRMNEFLDSVQATPAERTATAVAAAAQRLNHFNGSDWVIDEMKQAFNTHALEQTDGLVGKALADSTQLHWGLPFENAAHLAQQYHKDSGNDEVLVSFLEKLIPARSEKPNPKDLDKMIKLAGEIKDEERRTQILNGLKSNRSQP